MPSEPLPIASVMSEVLARYGLREAPVSGAPVAGRLVYLAEPVEELAVA